MKKMTLVVLAVLAIVMFYAGMALADDIGIGIENESNTSVTAIGGSATNTQQQGLTNTNEICVGGGAGGKGGEGGQGGAGGHGGNVGDTTATVGNVTGGSVGNTTADADASANIGDTTAKNETNVNGIKGDQTTKINFEDNSRSLGSLPQASTHGVGTAVIPMNEYGHLITQFSGVSFGCETMTMLNFETMVSVMNETEGSQSWEDLDEKIIPYPLARNRYASIGENDPVYFFGNERAGEIFSRVENKDLVGLWVYNSEFNKEEPVLMPHFKARAYLDASKMGANVVISVDQMFQGYFVPEGFELSVGGLASWVSRSFTGGQSIAGGAGMARQQNTEFGRPGAAFVFIRVNNPEEFCMSSAPAPAPVRVAVTEEKIVEPACDPQPIISKIRQLEEGTKNCPNDCLNNEMLRKQLGDAYLDLFYCVGNSDALVKAIAEYKKAETNFLEGREPNGTRTSTLQGAQEILYKAHYNSALAIFELSGPDAETEFAQQKKLGERGDGMMPDNQNDIKR